MNAIRATRQLNQRELDNAVPPSASWHVDYRDTAYVYIGGLPLDLSEGDVVTIFSQFGHPTHLNLVRDKETGKSRGFAFLKYEDQRSCDLAVDNLGGAEVLGRILRVDHSRYKKKDGEDEDTWRIDRLEKEGVDETKGSDTGDEQDESEEERRRRKKRKTVKADKETLAIEQGIDDDDPMKDYLLQERREEAEKATAEGKERRHKHHHRRSHRDRDGEDDRQKSRRHRDRDADSDGEHRSRRHRNVDRHEKEDDTRGDRHRHRDEDRDVSRRDRDRDRDRDVEKSHESSRRSRDKPVSKRQDRSLSKSRSRSPEQRNRRRRSRSRDRDVGSKRASRYSRSPSIDRKWDGDKYRDVRRKRDYE